MQAKVTDVVRATEELKGIVAGIACDYEISDEEIGALSGWLNVHANLCNRQPFKELSTFLKSMIADQVIEEDEREDLVAWCQQYGSSESPAMNVITAGIRRLHGFLQGLALDGQVTEKEVFDLQDWLHEYEALRDYWPFDDIWALTERILKDGRVTEKERQRVLDYCKNFAEIPLDRQLVHDTYSQWTEAHMISNAPIVPTLAMVCETNPEIVFKDHSFCFTGHASSGKRKDLHAITEALGGIISTNIVLDLHFLVIGALSQPAWAYSTYGRKIEAVMENRKRGAKTLIVHEDDWLLAAGEQHA